MIPVNLVPYAPCVLGLVLDMQRAEVQDCHVHQEDANVELDVSREARPRACAVMFLHGVHRKIFGERVCTHNYFFTLVEFRAVEFRAVELRAVELRAVEFRAVELRVVEFRVVEIRVVEILVTKLCK